jgi:hypothetical protein
MQAEPVDAAKASRYKPGIVALLTEDEINNSQIGRVLLFCSNVVDL